MHPPESGGEIVIFEMYSLSVLGFFGSKAAPDEATLRDEAHALQCTTEGPYNAFPTDLLRLGSMCGLGLDKLGSALSAQPPGKELPPTRATTLRHTRQRSAVSTSE